MKTFLTILITFSIGLFSNAQVLELPFFDDFSNDYENWDTYSATGDLQWHISGDDGQDGSKCARIYTNNSPEENDDWLISPAFNTESISDIKVTFDYWYYGGNFTPEFYYSTNYSGDFENSNWTKIEYSFTINEWSWKNIYFNLDVPADTFVFAFRYQSGVGDDDKIMIDNFSIESFEPLILEKVGESVHFEFYTSKLGQEDFYADYMEDLEYTYERFKSIWERPTSNTIFPNVEKIKIFYNQRSDILENNGEMTEWDCGAFNFQTGEIYIAPLDNDVRLGYYGTVGKLMQNELAQMALTGWLDFDLDAWFVEGFGLYEMGYRPERDKLLSKLSELGTNEPPLESIMNIEDLPDSGNKDLMASFFQSKALIHCYFYGYWGDDTYKWWQILKHYYIKEIDRVELLYSSEHFDIYGASKEMSYVEAMANDMENQLKLQESRFGQLMKHRANICIYDNEVGKEINETTDFQALTCGADKISTSHLDIDDYGMLHHEFMHAWINMMSPIEFANGVPFPGQFLNEGLAESSDKFMADEEMPAHRYKIQGLYYHYQRKYNREPSWLEIVDNAEVNKEDGFWVDAYALGEMYWRYLNDKYPDNYWNKVGRFLEGGRDWTVFSGKTAEQEGAEFIQFMKELAFVGPPLETTSLPFFENFRNDFTGWTLMRFKADDYWQLADNAGYDDQLCAYIVDPYWLDEKEVDSWLVTPPLDVSAYNPLTISFRYKQYNNGLKPEIYFTEVFSGPTVQTEWTKVENIQWNAAVGQWDKIEFQITNPADRLFIALRFLSKQGNYASYFIDNFQVTGISTGIYKKSFAKNDLRIYPNPATTESIITFQTNVSGNVNLSIFDIQGRKICTLINEKLNAGMHTVSLSNSLPVNGV